MTRTKDEEGQALSDLQAEWDFLIPDVETARMTDTTPTLNAAIFAACSAWHEGDCEYPTCSCAPVVPSMIDIAARVLCPKEPPAEWIEAVARALGGVTAGAGWHKKALAAYRAQPLWIELWRNSK